MNEKPRMFQNPFSIKGRIRRLEYGISYLIYLAYYFFIVSIVGFAELNEAFIFILLLPAYWFLIAQGTKRCHDRDNSGWYQLIPFYGLWMLFGGSDYGENYYGPNPKGEGNENIDDMIDEIGTPETD
jgi:uncharacterized membrane protein YhaH (DUF805 family)